MPSKSENREWTTIITPKKRTGLMIREVLSYRDLIWLNVCRIFKVKYKQTVLGPLWFVIQPLLTTLVHTLIFGNLAGLAPDVVPTFLFYMSANVMWLYFSGCLSATSTTFLSHARLFEKVYFPRLTMPISTIISSGLKFFIEFGVFLVAMLIYYLSGANFKITWVAALTPILLMQLGLLAMAIGIIISSITVKYRDLQVLVSFGLQLWMYLTPVVYGLDSISSQTLKTIILCNPVSPVIELMRYGWLGVGSTPWEYWGISLIVTFVILIIGVLAFNKAERNFVDMI